jgi:hypothetical protein
MAKVDAKARLIWAPNAIRHCEPQNPNVVIHWRNAWRLTPECALRQAAGASLRAYMVDRDAERVKGASARREQVNPTAFADAFDAATGGAFAVRTAEPPPESFGVPTWAHTPNKDQEQDQEQDSKIPPVAPPVRQPAAPPAPEHTQGGEEEHEDALGRALLAAIRSHAVLAPVATRAVVDALLGQLLNKPRPQATVEQAIADVARDAAMADATGSPWGPEHTGKMLGVYVDRARLHGAARAPADAAKAFLGRWCASYRQAVGQPYVRSDEDLDTAARIVAAADAAAQDTGGAHTRDAFLAHWVHRYLADEGEAGYVAKSNWPLRHLPRRVSGYGVPRPPKAAAASTAAGAPPEPAPPVDLAAQKASAEAVAAVLRGGRSIPMGRA